jgi:hypothetical protein
MGKLHTRGFDLGRLQNALDVLSENAAIHQLPRQTSVSGTMDESEKQIHPCQKLTIQDE